MSPVHLRQLPGTEESVDQILPDPDGIQRPRRVDPFSATLPFWPVGSGPVFSEGTSPSGRADALAPEPRDGVELQGRGVVVAQVDEVPVDTSKPLEYEVLPFRDLCPCVDSPTRSGPHPRSGFTGPAWFGRLEHEVPLPQGPVQLRELPRFPPFPDRLPQEGVEYHLSRVHLRRVLPVAGDGDSAVDVVLSPLSWRPSSPRRPSTRRVRGGPGGWVGTTPLPRGVLSLHARGRDVSITPPASWGGGFLPSGPGRRPVLRGVGRFQGPSDAVVSAVYQSSVPTRGRVGLVGRSDPRPIGSDPTL